MLLNDSPINEAPLDDAPSNYNLLKVSVVSDVPIEPYDGGRLLIWDVLVDAALVLLQDVISVYTPGGSGPTIVTKVSSDTLIISDTGTVIARLRSALLTEALLLADSTVIARLRNRLLVDGTTLLDSLIASTLRIKFNGEVIVSLDTSSMYRLRTAFASDFISVIDAAIAQRVKVRDAEDTLSITDLGRELIWELLADGNILITDQILSSASGGAVVTKISSDAVIITDGYIKVLLRTRELLEAIISIDTVAGRDITTYATFSEAVDLSDSWLARRLRTLVSTDGVTLVDFMTNSATSNRVVTTSESIIVFDATIRTAIRNRMQSDNSVISEGFAKALTRIQSAVDGIVFSDDQLKMRRYTTGIEDYVTITDEALRSIIQAVLYDLRAIIGIASPTIVLGTDKFITLGVAHEIELGAYH